jgi:serine/threonine protein kinase
VPDHLVAGRYRLEQELGRGGMGVVWRAVDTLIERTVALKELRPPPGDDSSFVERALREARNAGRLGHPSIVAVHDVIAPTAGGEPVVYLVMEYVPAPSLAEVIDRDGPLPPARVAAMGLGILDALTAAHALGVVHRDVKPGNVLVPNDDRVKLTDFGIALAAEDTRLTRSGVMGTHAYLAPECFDSGQVGPATDLWALGATLFHAVAGRAPFERPTTTATLRAILFEDAPAPPCGPPLADVIAGLLTRSPEQRLGSGAARELLQRAVSAPTPAPPPPTTNPGQPVWESQATTHHRAPGPPGPAAPPSPPPPFGPSPPMPAGPPMAPSPPGPAAPPQRRSTTPLVLGLLGAVAAVVLLVVLLGSGGDSDDDGGGTVAGQTPAPSGQIPGAGDVPTVPADPAMADGQALSRQFLDLVEAGDADSAIAMLCTEGVDGTQEYADNVTAVAGDADLEIDTDTAELVSEGVVYSADLTGTVHGDSVTRAHIGTAARDNCIVTFSAEAD